MDNNVLIHPKDIPYDELEQLGLEHVMVDDLPQEAMDNLLQSRPTPLLSLSVRKNDGDVKRFRGRVMLLGFDDGSVHAVVVPRMKKAYGLEEFESDAQDYLTRGGVLLVQEPTGSYYAQFDSVTNQVWKTESAAVDYNLRIITGNPKNAKYFDGDSEEALKQGQPVTLTNEEGDGRCTVGIDLLTPTGIRFAAGGEEDFEEDKRTDDMMRYSFGNYGCWVLTENDSLEYIKEEDFTSEIRELQKRLLKASHQEEQRKQNSMS